MISRLLKAPMPLLRQVVLDRDGEVRPSAQRVVRLVAWAWLTIGAFLFVASWVGMGRPIYGLGYWLVYFSVSVLLIALTYPERQDSLRQIRDGLKSKSGGQGLLFGIMARTFSLAIALVLGIVRVIDLLLDSFVGELAAPRPAQAQADEGGWNSEHIHDVELGHEYYDPFRDDRWGQS